MVAKQKILIVDDDNNIAELISLYLAKECFDTKIVNDGEEALLAYQTYNPNLILLDLMLPGLSGEEVLKQIKGIPVIVLSAKLDMEHKAELLYDGAVDYVTKPFYTKELLARIRIHLRDTFPDQTSSCITYQDLTLHTDTREVSMDEKQIKLTRTEYAILKALMTHPTQVITKSVLLDLLCEETPDCTESSLKMHISNLRKKLREVSSNEYIEAIWGIGYKLNISE